MVQMSASEYLAERQFDVRSCPAMNVSRCHAGDTRIFFISGTNYRGARGGVGAVPVKGE